MISVTSNSLNAILNSRPRLSWKLFSGASITIALALFTFLGAYKIPGNWGENEAILLKVAFSIIVGFTLELMRYLIYLSMYFIKIEKKLSDVRPYIESRELRSELAKSSKYKENRREPIKIEGIRRHEGKIVIFVKREIDLKSGETLFLAEEGGDLVAEFTVDRENQDYWFARNTNRIDNLWLSGFSDQQEIWFGAYCTLYKVKE